MIEELVHNIGLHCTLYKYLIQCRVYIIQINLTYVVMVNYTELQIINLR